MKTKPTKPAATVAVTFRLPEAERRILERYCGESQRTKTDVLRELIRALDLKHHAARS